MKKIHLLFLIVAVALLSTLLTVLYHESSKILQTQEFEFSVSVINQSKTVGINVDPGGFYFGSLNRGYSSSRVLQITDVGEDARVYIYPEGKISGWLSYPNDLTIMSGDSVNVSVTITVPKDVALGNYTGKVRIVLRKA